MFEGHALTVQVSTATAAAASLNFSQRQCLYLEQVLIVVKVGHVTHM